MPLTATQIKNAKPQAKAYTLNDGHGLSLAIQPNGSKLWRFRKTIDGKPILRSLGSYPEISLADAREKASEYSKSLAQGVDPLEKKQQAAEKAAHTFKVVALEWHNKRRPQWSEGHAKKILDRLENNIFPFLGDLLIEEVTPPVILKTIRIMENRRAIDLAHRMHQIVSQIFRYAIATGRAERDNAADLRGALEVRKEKHHAALTDPKEVAQLLQAIESYQGSHVVRCAFKLTPVLFVRPGELRHMEWSEIDFEAREWRIPAHKMKMRIQHIVPLARQALVILEEIKPLTGHGKYVFPGRTENRPMSENTIGAALRNLGYSTREQQTAHGFRSMASTILNEMGWNRDAIERQLAHAERDGVRAAYNFAEYLPERRKMMQAWADFLDGLKDGGKVVPIGQAMNE